MIRRTAKYFSEIPPVFLDGLTYVTLAVFLFVQGQLGTDEAANFLAPTTLFWFRTIIGAIGAGLLALKMFRSRTFADHQDQQTADATQKPVVVEPSKEKIP